MRKRIVALVFAAGALGVLAPVASHTATTLPGKCVQKNVAGKVDVVIALNADCSR
jgi:hypothetical protein